MGEFDRDWGTEMWFCENFPCSYLFAGSRFHKEKIRRRHGGGERLVEESAKYHKTLFEHASQEGLKSNEIYSESGLRELLNGRYSDVEPKEVRIEAVETMKAHIEEHCPEKIEVAFLQHPIHLSFQMHRTSSHYWAYIWGEDTYLDTIDQKITAGLLREFERVLSRCEIQQKIDVIEFLDGLIKEIRERS